MRNKTKYSRYMPVTDHLGQKFDSVISCCRAWDIPEYTFRNRFLKGWDIERILTKEIVKRNFTTSDHLGNTFNSAADMCEYYGIDYDLYENRINVLHMSVKEGLTAPVRPIKRIICLSDGKCFESVSEMAAALGISRSAIYSRIKRGFSDSDLVGRKIKRGYKRASKLRILYNGRYYNSYHALCTYYDFPYGTFMYRLKSGWPIDQILSTPVQKR